MVDKVIIDQSHLLKHLEKNFTYIIIFLDDVKSLLELFFLMLALISLHFQYIIGNFPKFNCTQFSTKWISSFANESIFIALVVMLFVHNICCIVLVVLGIHVIEVDSMDIDIIHVL